MHIDEMNTWIVHLLLMKLLSCVFSWQSCGDSSYNAPSHQQQWIVVLWGGACIVKDNRTVTCTLKVFYVHTVGGIMWNKSAATCNIIQDILMPFRGYVALLPQYLYVPERVSAGFVWLWFWMRAVAGNHVHSEASETTASVSVVLYHPSNLKCGVLSSRRDISYIWGS